MNESLFPQQFVRQAVASADRRRRTEAAIGAAARVAPVGAAAVAALAVLCRLAGWPAWIGVACWMAAAATVAVIVWRAHRLHLPDDTTSSARFQGPSS